MKKLCLILILIVTSICFGEKIESGDVGRNVYFVAVDANDYITRETSLTSAACYYSIDGGATWSTIDWPKMGKLGQYLVKVEAWKMVSFYDIQFRLTVSDPVFSSLHDGSIEVRSDGY